MSFALLLLLSFLSLWTGPEWCLQQHQLVTLLGVGTGEQALGPALLGGLPGQIAERHLQPHAPPSTALQL